MNTLSVTTEKNCGVVLTMGDGKAQVTFLKKGNNHQSSEQETQV